MFKSKTTVILMNGTEVLKIKKKNDEIVNCSIEISSLKKTCFFIRDPYMYGRIVDYSEFKNHIHFIILYFPLYLQ